MSHRTRLLSSSLFLLSVALLLGVSLPGSAVTLDREGKGTQPSWFTCHKDIDLVKAGGKPYFKIELKGHCGVHPGGGLVGWTPVEWKEVTVLATYNYDTGVTTETIWAGPDVMIDAKLQCEKNPWAHGNACTPTQEVTNNTGVAVNWNYPLSAQRMSYLQRQVVAKWESKPPEPTLADWVPFTTGKAEVSIVWPKLSNPVPQGAANFVLEAVAAGNALSTNAHIEFEWNQILPPKDSSIEIGGRWVPYSTTNTPKQILHSSLPVNVSTFPNRGLYAVRAKLVGHPDNTKTDWKLAVIKSDDALIVFGEGMPQEMNADAALQLISRPAPKAPAGLGRTGIDRQPATPTTSILQRPSLQGKAMPKIQPMGPVPDSVRTNGQIQKRSPAADTYMSAPKSRTTSPVKTRNKGQIGELSPPVSRSELSPPVSKEATDAQPEKTRAAPAMQKAAPSVR